MSKDFKIYYTTEIGIGEEYVDICIHLVKVRDLK